MKCPESLPRHVGVDLGRPKIAVPEEQLHDTEIGAAVDEMRGERVPKDMGAHALLEPRAESVGTKDGPYALTGEGATAGVHEKPRGLARPEKERPRGAEVTLEPQPGFLPHGDDALLAPFAPDPHHALAGAVGGGTQPHKLAHPQPTGIENLEEGAIAESEGGAGLRSLEKRRHLPLAQRAREWPPEARAGQRQRGIITAFPRCDEETVVAAERAQQAGLAARRATLGLKRGETGEQGGGTGRRQTIPGRAEATGKAAKIEGVGNHRIGREPIGEPTGVKKPLEEPLILRPGPIAPGRRAHSARR